MSIPFYSGEIPAGLFSFLLNLWTPLRRAFFSVVSFFTEQFVTGTNYTLLMILIGGGLTTWISITIAKWVVKWF
jgi:hypothetical protein